MLNILIIEDDTMKLSTIIESIIDKNDENNINIDYSNNILCAKRKLKENFYDTLIVDIMLPDRIDKAQINRFAGIELIRELNERNIYNNPAEIICLTQHEDVFEEINDEVEKLGFHTLRYSRDSEIWKEKLLARIKNLVDWKNKSNQKMREIKSKICIVCALQEPELSAVLNLNWDWKEIKIPDDDNRYFEGTLINGDCKEKVYAAASPRMGMPAAAILATKMIEVFSPEYICMVGICAGFEDKTNFGDIIIADPAWDYGAGKYKEVGDGTYFEIEPHQIPLDSSIRNIFDELKGKKQLLFDIKNNYQGDTPQSELNAIIGPCASGASVIASEEKSTELKKQHRKIVGFEMEAYSVYLASQEARHPKPKVFAVKSVVDFGNGEKSDSFHNYAAYTSANFLKHFVENKIF